MERFWEKDMMVSWREQDFRDFVKDVKMLKKYYGNALKAMSPFSLDKIEIHMNTNCHLFDCDNTDPHPIYIDDECFDKEIYELFLDFLITVFNKKFPRLGDEIER